MDDDSNKWFFMCVAAVAVAISVSAVASYQQRGVIGVEAAKNGLVQDWRGHWVLTKSEAEEPNE